jgi:GT2 family glycosyltransferase
MTHETGRPASGALRVSAVIPCFNAAPYLGEALSSIGNQTRPVQEVIVVDDGSSDGSAEVAERWGATVIRLGRNRGHGFARNVGVRAASGDAIAWLDADDSWRPNHVEVIAGLLERYPEAASASGALQRFGLDDQVVYGLIPPGEPCELLPVAFQSWLHAGSSSIMRRSALEAIGGFDEQNRVATDFDMWLRMARHHRFVATSEITGNWRWHESQISAAPLGQILAVRRYRRRFLKTLRAQGDGTLASELEPLARPAWTAHLEGVLGAAEQRKRRSAESRGEPYSGPTTVDRARRAALIRLPPSAVNALWHVTRGALEA